MSFQTLANLPEKPRVPMQISADRPAGSDQADRLRELARAPELPDDALSVVEAAIRSGLNEAQAYELIGRLGAAIAEKRSEARG